jgi:hypothetical protein
MKRCGADPAHPAARRPSGRAAASAEGARLPRRRRPPIQRGAWDAQDLTRGAVPIDVATARRPHQSSSSLGMGFRGICRSSATFFWKASSVSAFCSRVVRRRFSCSSFFSARIDGTSLASAGLRRQPVLALPAPRHEMRRVQPLLPQERPELAVSRTGIGLPEDRELVGGREAPRAWRTGTSGPAGRGPRRARPRETLRYGPPRFARRPSAPALPRSTGPASCVFWSSRS